MRFQIIVYSKWGVCIGDNGNIFWCLKLYAKIWSASKILDDSDEFLLIPICRHFHTLTAKLLYLGKRVRPDILKCHIYVNVCKFWQMGISRNSSESSSIFASHKAWGIKKCFHYLLCTRLIWCRRWFEIAYGFHGGYWERSNLFKK